MIDLLDRLALRATQLLLALAIFAALAMMLHICADIVAKHFFSRPVPATLEIVSAYYMAAIGFCGLAYVQSKGSHIAIELFSERLSSRALAVLMVGVHALTLVFCVLLVIASTKSALHATEFGEAVMVVDWELPTWPSRWLVPVSAAAMALVVLVQLLRAIGPACAPAAAQPES
jgi:TRAP-type C4-dicarboxylate transport system permease small subunit